MEGDLKHVVAHEKMREVSSGHPCTGVCGGGEQGSAGQCAPPPGGSLAGHIVSQGGNQSQAATSCTARRAMLPLVTPCPTVRPPGLQHARPPCRPLPEFTLRSIESVMHPAISSSAIPFSSRPQSLPHQGLFQGVGSSHQEALPPAFHRPQCKVS